MLGLSQVAKGLKAGQYFARQFHGFKLEFRKKKRIHS